MVVIGTLLAAAVVLFWLSRGGAATTSLRNRWFLAVFAVIAGPLAVLALEFGWIATEVGRQPWTVWQILRTSDAASMSTGLWWSYLGVLVIYARYDRRAPVWCCGRWPGGGAPVRPTCPARTGRRAEEPVP